MTGLIVGILLTLGGVGLTGSAASAHDHAPPKTLLRVNDETLQRGLLGSMCWTTGGSPPGTAVTGCGDGWWAFPKAKYVPPGSVVTIRIMKSQAPIEFEIHAWKRLNRYGAPAGRATALPYVAHPALVNGRVVWDLTFALSNDRRHYYIDTFGIWRDEEGTGATQDASWTFHIRTFR